LANGHQQKLLYPDTGVLSTVFCRSTLGKIKSS